MPIRGYSAILLTTTATFVWAIAAASDCTCISHPTLPICDNPQTPPPEFGHELPGSPYNPINAGASITVESTATASSTGGIVAAAHLLSRL
jgi:hypothetical protein